MNNYTNFLLHRNSKGKSSATIYQMAVKLAQRTTNVTFLRKKKDWINKTGLFGHIFTKDIENSTCQTLCSCMSSARPELSPQKTFKLSWNDPRLKDLQSASGRTEVGGGESYDRFL